MLTPHFQNLGDACVLYCTLLNCTIMCFVVLHCTEQNWPEGSTVILPDLILCTAYSEVWYSTTEVLYCTVSTTHLMVQYNRAHLLYSVHITLSLVQCNRALVLHSVHITLDGTVQQSSCTGQFTHHTGSLVQYNRALILVFSLYKYKDRTSVQEIRCTGLLVNI